MSWLNKLSFGLRSSSADSSPIAQGADDDIPAPGQLFAQFGLGCFWGPELAYQRVPGVTKTEVGYTQGYLHNPTYEDICSGTTNHSEVVRVQYDPKDCSYDTLLDVFWARHDPTTPNRQSQNFHETYLRQPSSYSTVNRTPAPTQPEATPLLPTAPQFPSSPSSSLPPFNPPANQTVSASSAESNRRGNDVGTQYRSGIYFYTPEQEKAALESRDRQQKLLNRKIVSEILPGKKFYRAEEYHQQYLAKGGRFGFRQSSEKGCNDPIRCYG
ncbi:hypothetical protein SASPL_123409 [Salvia splendens]|uniref:peptide-methionine (S)-S-oxide reductase n=1 Tax=Salvia splendens TaxID=180675 RepID=A0A8X8XLM2_SALSN|nr:hypothetical protein SASPL_123409 [Salvia splendens]